MHFILQKSSFSRDIYIFALSCFCFLSPVSTAMQIVFQLLLENYAIKLSLAVATLNLQKCDI